LFAAVPAALAAAIALHASRAADAPLHMVARVEAQHRPSDGRPVAISADGRFVAFASYARLSPADENKSSDIYLLDRDTQAISLESPPFDSYAGGNATSPSVSDGGRFVVYLAHSVAASGARIVGRVVLRDRLLGISRVVEPAGRSLDGDSFDAQIAANGETIVFATTATNVEDAGAAAAHAQHVFLADRATWRFEKISVDTPQQTFAEGASFRPAVSADGRFVAFTWRPHGPDVNVDRRRVNVYLRDRRRELTLRIGTTAAGGAPNGACYAPVISGDGRFVAFVSEATNLTADRDRNGAPDVFLRDAVANVTQLLSRRSGGGVANGSSTQPAISANGRFVVFESDASDIVCVKRCEADDRDTNLVADILLLDRQTGTARRISRGREPWIETSVAATIDGTGHAIAFLSRHPIDALDDRDDFDLFLTIR
jgi:Tol biopolymer transport system component